MLTNSACGRKQSVASPCAICELFRAKVGESAGNSRTPQHSMGSSCASFQVSLRKLAGGFLNSEHSELTVPRRLRRWWQPSSKLFNAGNLPCKSCFTEGISRSLALSDRSQPSQNWQSVEVQSAWALGLSSAWSLKLVTVCLVAKCPTSANLTLCLAQDAKIGEKVSPSFSAAPLLLS